MSKSIIAIIIYIIGLIVGAVVMGLWDAETTVIKGGIALGWTVALLVTLLYTDKYEKK
mgnify:CR=1 FL=1|tara:strand:+ start:244 stop:417 length:174 start_codon:yes stop_codon:yes gene_type:complete